MISWAPLDPAPDLARAIPCSINTTVLDNQGNMVPLPARIYVKDALTLAISKENMVQVLAALIEAIFVVMGVPDTSVRQCSLAMDKWEKLHIAPIQTMLGLLINTNRMIVSIPDNYIQGVCLLIESTWHTYCQWFKVKEAQELTGKLGHLAEGANWVFHLVTYLYTSIAYVLLENNKFLADSSLEFQSLIKSLWSGYFFINVKDHIRHISFAIKRSEKLVHQLQWHHKVYAPRNRFFRKKLRPNSRIHWESPIARIIPRMPTFITFGDSCLEGAGGYSLSLGFWWHLPFLEEVKLHTLQHKQDNADGQLISINVLEFVTVIINYCAALHMVLSTNPTNDPYPMLLNVTDNASALSWTTGACHRSRMGCLLAHRPIQQIIKCTRNAYHLKWLQPHVVFSHHSNLQEKLLADLWWRKVLWGVVDADLGPQKCNFPARFKIKGECACAGDESCQTAGTVYKISCKHNNNTCNCFYIGKSQWYIKHAPKSI
jgi:hypothetical protein